MNVVCCLLVIDRGMNVILVYFTVLYLCESNMSVSKKRKISDKSHVFKEKTMSNITLEIKK